MRECELNYQLFDPYYKPEPSITEPEKKSKDTGLLFGIVILLALVIIGEMVT